MKNPIITWQKIKNKFKVWLVAWPVFFLLLLAVSYSSHKNENKIRRTVNLDPVETKATIISVSNKKRARYAEYVFEVNGISCKGKTFYAYSGMVGDTICVTYNKLNPAWNIYCGDEGIENFSSDVLPTILKYQFFIICGSILFIPLMILSDHFRNKNKLKYAGDSSDSDQQTGKQH